MGRGSDVRVGVPFGGFVRQWVAKEAFEIQNSIGEQPICRR
jgi:hypothetical protein